MDLHSDLASLLEQIGANCTDARKLTDGLSDAQFNTRPPEGGWSISECLAHLNVVNRLDLPNLARIIEEAKVQGRFHPGPYRYGWFSRWFVRNAEPPARLKLKAPKIYEPRSGEPLDKVLAEYLAIQERVAQLVRRSSGLDLARIKAPTPVSRLVKFPLGMRFALIAAHDRRHLAQAWQVRQLVTGAA